MKAVRLNSSAHKPAIQGKAPALPVARPLLPDAEAIAPYLRRIDNARWYSNFGPLNAELEARLSTHAGGAATCTVANATQGLALLLRAVSRGPGVCLMPGFSFVATAHAAAQAGLTPYFIDVDSASWMLTPERARAAIARATSPVCAIVVVAAFGAMPDLEGFAALERETGVPVIVDAAAAFDTLVSTLASPLLPAVVSLHATKVLGAGEGGYVVAPRAELIEKVRALSSFGFAGSRIASQIGTNAKMSEYGAAIALAALDQWPEQRALWMEAARKLRLALTRRSAVRLQPGWGVDWVSSTCALEVDGAKSAIARLAADGIVACQWWGDGLHREPAFAAFPREKLTNVEALAARVIGAPFFVDMKDADVRRVADALGAM
jgi:dTDP-4-amino-4,6-dideoxygalactose transaminase